VAALSILTLNTGSSSLKFALYRMGGVEGEHEQLDCAGKLDRLTDTESGSARFRVGDASGSLIVDEAGEVAGHDAARAHLFDWVQERLGAPPDGIGHRLVHGGTLYRSPRRINEELRRALDQLVPLAPEHLPREIDGIDAAGKRFPTTAQVACFDTAFHRTMPRVAEVLPVPRELEQRGVQRYGFHGLSYEFIAGELAKLAAPGEGSGRVVAAHLGNGASMAALLDGVSIDTTMGMTPAGGLVMSTRSGDLDPGVLVYMVRHQRLDPDELNELVNRHSGLLGVSGSSSDMRDLLAREEMDPRARLAVALFCYQARKNVAALAAVLGGLDQLVFTGGIGERSAVIRARIAEGLEFLGIELERARNEGDEGRISTDRSAVTVRVIPTNEELIIARHTARLLAAGEGAPRASEPIDRQRDEKG